jgi:hypothetical protein
MDHLVVAPPGVAGEGVLSAPCCRLILKRAPGLGDGSNTILVKLAVEQLNDLESCL